MKNQKSKVVGHLGFRKGSKGVPGKNQRIFCGKPLYLWALEQLASLDYIDDFIISTDYEDGYLQSLNYGAKDIGMRNSKLCADDTSKFLVWRDSYHQFKKKYYDFDVMLDIDCTCPLRSNEDIINGLNKFNFKSSELVLGITEAKKNPYFNLLEADNSGYLNVSKGDGKQFTRQGTPDVYEHVSSIYVLKTKILDQYEKLYDAKIEGFNIPHERSIDIDSEIDWKINEYLMNER